VRVKREMNRICCTFMELFARSTGVKSSYFASMSLKRNETIASFLFYLPWSNQPGYGLGDQLGPSMSVKFVMARPSD
jgi:hypothetical protein